MTARLNEAQRSVVDTLRAHWRLYVFEGVVMIVLGVLAIVFPVFATLAVALYLGWLFLFCGILALIVMITTGHIPGFWWALVTAILAVLVGLALLLKPAAGIVSLTAVLTAFFIVEGVFQTVAALESPRSDPPFLGLAARKRHRRSRARGDHHLRMARHSRLDARAARRREPAHLWLGDRHGGDERAPACGGREGRHRRALSPRVGRTKCHGVARAGGGGVGKVE